MDLAKDGIEAALGVAAELADGIQVSDIPKLMVATAPLLTKILSKGEITDEERAEAASLRITTRLMRSNSE